MTPEQKLDALFAADEPPTRDLAFQAVTAERIARRRAWARVGAMVPWTISAAVMLWALAPMLAPALVAMAGVVGATLAPTAAILCCVALLAATLRRGGLAIGARPPRA